MIYETQIANILPVGIVRKFVHPSLSHTRNRHQRRWSPASPIVRSIEISSPGLSKAEKKRFIAKMHTKVGKPYSERTIEEDIRSFYDTKGVIAAPISRIFGVKVANGVKVTIVINTATSNNTGSIAAFIAKNGWSNSQKSPVQDEDDGRTTLLRQFYQNHGYVMNGDNAELVLACTTIPAGATIDTRFLNQSVPQRFP